jgi:hypothetical protein
MAHKPAAQAQHAAGSEIAADLGRIKAQSRHCCESRTTQTPVFQGLGAEWIKL